ncbi:helix-turn-helix domain-containing protein [Micromonospora sp. BRA006-A]|nr:helix-turn-helix domain-containing protein [Micromonospora sp. BRA006-A]
MSMERWAETALHPVRIRILRAAAGARVTTHDLVELLPDVPQATLYRHLATLVKTGMLDVVQEREVRGAVERVYALPAHGAALDPAGLATATPRTTRATSPRSCRVCCRVLPLPRPGVRRLRRRRRRIPAARPAPDRRRAARVRGRAQRAGRPVARPRPRRRTDPPAAGHRPDARRAPGDPRRHAHAHVSAPLRHDEGRRLMASVTLDRDVIDIRFTGWERMWVGRERFTLRLSAVRYAAPVDEPIRLARGARHGTRCPASPRSASGASSAVPGSSWRPGAVSPACTWCWTARRPAGSSTRSSSPTRPHRTWPRPSGVRRGAGHDR